MLTRSMEDNQNHIETQYGSEISSQSVLKTKQQEEQLDRHLVNKPRDGAPMTRLLIADLETSSAIAFATLSDSMTTTST